jgi:Rnl2 family RNA ligase
MDQNAINNERNMVMDFTRYNSLENTYRQKAIDSCHTLGITEWVALEKIHGSNWRAGCLPIYTNHDNFFKRMWSKFKSWYNDGYEFVYGSHNVQITHNNKNDGYYGKDIYGEVAKKYNMKKIIPKDYVVYGEVYGNGVQDLQYGLNDRDLVIFDVKYKNEFLPYKELKEFCQKRNLPMAPELYVGLWKPELIDKYISGMSKLCSDQIREGIIIKDYFESNHPRCVRKILKYKSEDYLLRKNGTEYH